MTAGVYLSDCFQNKSKSYGGILMKLSGNGGRSKAKGTLIRRQPSSDHCLCAFVTTGVTHNMWWNELPGRGMRSLNVLS